MSEANPIDRVVRLCLVTNFDKSLKPTCHSCRKGHEDWDGDGYSQWYCGIECSDRSGQEYETYLEDQGVDVNETHPCFEPDFWHTGFAEMLDGTKEMEDKALKLYRAAIEG
jgi:hypothetical protein